MFFHRLKSFMKRYRFFYNLLHSFRYFSNSDYRKKHRVLDNKLKALRNQTGGMLETRLGDGSAGVAIFFGWSQFEHIMAETVVRKGFDRANYRIKVMTEPMPATRAIYNVLGVEALESFQRYCPVPDKNEAASILQNLGEDIPLTDIIFEGISIGKYTASTLMRRRRLGSVDRHDPEIIDEVIALLASSVAAVRGAKAMLEKFSPSCVVLVDRGYTPFGEIFDVCVQQGVEVITWNAAHRNNTLMLKRYNRNNKLEHPSSLSEKSWSLLKQVSWDQNRQDCLYNELSSAYTSGEWYGEVGTQVDKQFWDENEITEKLGLDKNKKTAVIYAHIFWDATFFWGVDLFRDYSDWFIATVRAACENGSLNWLIKVHPANLVKNRRDGIDSDPSEVIALRDHIGRLPDHVKVIPADADISTLSLFKATDYCLTVRGTVGIEAALFGNTVLTAGTGRYDRHGFTLDFDTRDSYLDTLSKLETVVGPNIQTRNLAERFAYGIFIARPLHLKLFDFQFLQDETATLSVNFNVETLDELKNADEINLLSTWLSSDDDDFLITPI